MAEPSQFFEGAVDEDSLRRACAKKYGLPPSASWEDIDVAAEKARNHSGMTPKLAREPQQRPWFSKAVQAIFQKL